MKRLLMLALVCISFNSLASTLVKTCSQVTKVCASYETDIPFSVGQEGRFKLSLESADQKDLNFIKADLWMQMGSHGHGSSPLKIVPVSPLQFDVTKAYFVMKGNWQIRVTYEQESIQETLILPVAVIR